MANKDEEKIEELDSSFEEFKQKLIQIKNFFESIYQIGFEEPSDENKRRFEKIRDTYFETSLKMEVFFDKYPEYLSYELRRGNINYQLSSLLERLSSQSDKFNKLYIIKVSIKVNLITEMFNDLLTIKNKENEWRKKTESLNIKLKQAENTVANIEAAKLALEGHDTEKIYSSASSYYLEKSINYEVFFYLLVFFAICITFVSFRHFSYANTNPIDFILSKVMITTVVITLGTIFLRKSSHLRKLHDQAHQTSLELKALPLFIKSLDPKDQHEIIKELSRKYFGKDVSQNHTDKVGDLIHDQLKVSTDLVKTSSELIKNLSKVQG